MRPFALGLVVALLAAAPGLAQAQDEEPALPDISAASMFEFTDTSGDGRITMDEVRALDERLEKDLEAAGEDEAKIEAVFGRYVNAVDLHMFLGADADDDLVLTKAELEAALEKDDLALSDKDYAVLGEETAGRLWPELLADLDEDKDGALSAAELGEDELFGPGSGFASLDGDKDGKLVKAELAAYLKVQLKKEDQEALGPDDEKD